MAATPTVPATLITDPAANNGSLGELTESLPSSPIPFGCKLSHLLSCPPRLEGEGEEEEEGEVEGFRKNDGSLNYDYIDAYVIKTAEYLNLPSSEQHLDSESELLLQSLQAKEPPFQSSSSPVVASSSQLIQPTDDPTSSPTPPSKPPVHFSPSSSSVVVASQQLIQPTNSSKDDPSTSSAPTQNKNKNKRRSSKQLASSTEPPPKSSKQLASSTEPPPKSSKQLASSTEPKRKRQKPFSELLADAKLENATLVESMVKQYESRLEAFLAQANEEKLRQEAATKNLVASLVQQLKIKELNKPNDHHPAADSSSMKKRKMSADGFEQQDQKKIADVLSCLSTENKNLRRVTQQLNFELDVEKRRAAAMKEKLILRLDQSIATLELLLADSMQTKQMLLKPN